MHRDSSRSSSDGALERKNTTGQDLSSPAFSLQTSHTVTATVISLSVPPVSVSLLFWCCVVLIQGTLRRGVHSLNVCEQRADKCTACIGAQSPFGYFYLLLDTSAAPHNVARSPGTKNKKGVNGLWHKNNRIRFITIVKREAASLAANQVALSVSVSSKQHGLFVYPCPRWIVSTCDRFHESSMRNEC